MAEEWDNVGLQIGSSSLEVKKILVALDVDENVVQEAVDNNVQLIISHHPLLMKGIKSINIDQPKGNLISKLIKNNISVYAAHTNLDSVQGGVNTILAEKLGLKNIDVLHIVGSEKYVKLVAYVPEGHQDTVRDAISEAGAGWIGNYSHCTFQVSGTGTFCPREGTNPYIGSEGELEHVGEKRLETIVPVEKLSEVVSSMISAHPYEEVAYDIYPLENQGPAYGLGRIGQLDEPIAFSEIVKLVKRTLNLDVVKTGGSQHKLIKKVAVCGGSVGELWPVALAKGADAYITGDIKYHTAQDMTATGLSFIDAGHYGTEVPVVEKVCVYLNEICAKENIKVEVVKSKTQKEPFTYL